MMNTAAFHMPARQIKENGPFTVSNQVRFLPSARDSASINGMSKFCNPFSVENLSPLKISPVSQCLKLVHAF
jgi:hypothetical protein